MPSQKTGREDGGWINRSREPYLILYEASKVCLRRLGLLLQFAKRLGVGVVLPLAVDVDGVCRKQKSSRQQRGGKDRHGRRGSWLGPLPLGCRSWLTSSRVSIV